MAKIIFIEGVSGVGKSTMVSRLAKKMQNMGSETRAYVEFDARNPIDFYCTAYLRKNEYEALSAKFCVDMKPIPAGNAVLVRYYDEDTPLYKETLLTQLAQKEFCYNPVHPVPLCEYTAAYTAVWKNFSANADADTYIFDGSLLHHPINDMMRNYCVSNEQAAAHVRALINALGDMPWRLYYLYTDDISSQLAKAHMDRKQNLPTDAEIAFWTARREKDRYVLQHCVPQYLSLDVSNNGWDFALRRILSEL